MFESWVNKSVFVTTVDIMPEKKKQCQKIPEKNESSNPVINNFDLLLSM